MEATQEEEFKSDPKPKQGQRAAQKLLTPERVHQAAKMLEQINQFDKDYANVEASDHINVGIGIRHARWNVRPSADDYDLELKFHILEWITNKRQNLVYELEEWGIHVDES